MEKDPNSTTEKWVVAKLQELTPEEKQLLKDLLLTRAKSFC